MLPHLLPQGDAVVFTIEKEAFQWDTAQVVVRSLATGAQTVLMDDAADARYVPSSGHLLFVRRGTLMAAPFDAARLELTGGAVAVLDGMMQAVNNTATAADSGAAQYATAPSGTLVYADGGPSPTRPRALASVTRTGVAERLSVPEAGLQGPSAGTVGRSCGGHGVDASAAHMVVRRGPAHTHPLDWGHRARGLWRVGSRRANDWNVVSIRRCDQPVPQGRRRHWHHGPTHHEPELPGAVRLVAGRQDDCLRRNRPGDRSGHLAPRRGRSQAGRAPMAEDTGRRGLSDVLARRPMAGLRLERVWARGGVRSALPWAGPAGARLNRGWRCTRVARRRRGAVLPDARHSVEPEKHDGRACPDHRHGTDGRGTAPAVRRERFLLL